MTFFLLFITALTQATDLDEGETIIVTPDTTPVALLKLLTTAVVLPIIQSNLSTKTKTTAFDEALRRAYGLNRNL